MIRPPAVRSPRGALRRALALGLLAGLLLLLAQWLPLQSRSGSKADLAPSGSAGSGQPPRAALQSLADGLAAGSLEAHALSRIERDLTNGLRRQGYVHFLEHAALAFVRNRQGQRVPAFADPGEAVLFDYIFGRGDLAAARYLHGWLQEGDHHWRAEFTQIGDGLFSWNNRGRRWLPFLEPLNLKGRKVCDLGGGIGYLAWMLAQSYGPETVFLAEIDTSGFEFIGFAAQHPGFGALASVRLHAVARPGARPQIPEPVDVILMSDVHALRDSDFGERGGPLLLNLARELLPGGVLALHEETFAPERTVAFKEIQQVVTARLNACGYDVLRLDPGQTKEVGVEPQSYNVYARLKSSAKMRNTLVRLN